MKARSTVFNPLQLIHCFCLSHTQSKLCEAYQAAALLLALGAGGQCIGLLACLVVATCSTLLIVAHSTDTNSTLVRMWCLPALCRCTCYGI